MIQIRRGYASLQERRSIKLEDVRSALDKLDFSVTSEPLIRQLLAQTTLLRSLPEAQRLHFHVVRAGLDQDTFIGNRLIKLFGKCGSVEESCRVFHTMKFKDSHTYNALIAAYAQNGHVEEARRVFESTPDPPGVLTWNFMIIAYAQNGHSHLAISCFHRMNAEGVLPNTYTLAAVVDACARVEALEQGELLHELIIGEGLETHTNIASAILTLYRRCGRLEQARKLFDRIKHLTPSLWTQMFMAYARKGQIQEARRLFNRMPDKDSVSWTCMVSAYTESGDWDEAEALFKQMPDRDVIAWNSIISSYAKSGHLSGALRQLQLMDLDGFQSNSITFLSLLDACTDMGASPYGLVIYQSISGSGIETTLPVANALMNMFGKCRELSRAKSLFDSMLKKDVISWTCMLSCFADNGSLVEAKQVLERMPEKQHVARVTMLVAYAQNGFLEEAQEFYDEAVQPDVVSWTSMITMYGQYGRGREALRILQTGDLEGLQADLVSFVGIIDACACCSARAEGRIIHSEVVERGFNRDPAVGCSIVNMYGKFGEAETAREVFDGMPYRNTVTWNAMLTAYAQNGHTGMTLELFPLMSLEGVEPTEISFIAILSACAQAGLLETGFREFVSMREDFWLVPSSQNYVCMIDLLGRVGRLEAAEEVSRSMPTRERRTAWTSLLGSCKLHGDRRRGGRAAKRAMDLEPETAAPYFLLSETCVADDSELY